jgi:glyoxylase-like metal-dependent hydrolase (beta-lactamase superfamily II)
VLNDVTTRSAAWMITVAAGVAFLAAGTGAQQPPAAPGNTRQGDAGLQIVHVRPNFYMIAGAGAHIGVSVGADGVVLVNAGTQQAAPAVLAEIRKITLAPIRYIINTSGDLDTLGGNATLGNFESVVNVAAHENVQLRASREGSPTALPHALWPSETWFEQRRYVWFNEEGIEIFHYNAHSDGDSIVFFRRSDVVVAGHVLDDTRFPVIDLPRGGSIQGEIAALNKLIELAIPPGPLVGTPPEGIALPQAQRPGVLSAMPGGTEVIPAYGRVYRQLDIVEYRDMVVIIRDWIDAYMDKNMTLEQIQAADPAKPWAPRFGATTGPWTTRQFVEAVYRSLMNERQKR